MTRVDYLPFHTRHDLPHPRVAEEVCNLGTNYPHKLQKHQLMAAIPHTDREFLLQGFQQIIGK